MTTKIVENLNDIKPGDMIQVDFGSNSNLKSASSSPNEREGIYLVLNHVAAIPLMQNGQVMGYVGNSSTYSTKVIILFSKSDREKVGSIILRDFSVWDDNLKFIDITQEEIDLMNLTK